MAVIAVDDPLVHVLMSMTGIDYFAALLILAEIGSVDRFIGDKQFCSWMGLTPRVWQSGEKIWVGGVGGLGNKRMRWLMVQCAHTARRFDPRMRRLYERHAARKGGNCAVAIVAHEMARILYYMLKRCEPYRGVNMDLWKRKPVEVREKCFNWFAELDWIPLGHLCFHTFFHRSLRALKTERGE